MNTTRIVLSQLASDAEVFSPAGPDQEVLEGDALTDEGRRMVRDLQRDLERAMPILKEDDRLGWDSLATIRLCLAALGGLGNCPLPDREVVGAVFNCLDELQLH